MWAPTSKDSSPVGGRGDLQAGSGAVEPAGWPPVSGKEDALPGSGLGTSVLIAKM